METTSTAAVALTVRYFAAARAAAGTETETCASRRARPSQALVDNLAARARELARVLRRCSFLCDGIAVRDETSRAVRRADNRCAAALCRRLIVIYVT